MDNPRIPRWFSLVILIATAIQPVRGADEKQSPPKTPAPQGIRLSPGESVKIDASGRIEKSTKSDDSAKKTAAIGENAAETADPYAVPEGASPELVAFIKGLIDGKPPKTATELRKLRAAIREAAEKILAAKPGLEELEFAVKAKMNMLDKPEQLNQFIVELKQAGHAKLARMVRGFALQVELRKQSRGSVVTKKLIEESLKHLEASPPQVSDQSLAYTAGMAAELSGDSALAVNTNERLAKIFARSGNPRLTEFSKVLEGIVRRLNLVGHEIKLEGKLLNGKPLDWSKYAGKVVLVYFWSTDYPACLGELPTLQKLYEQYHAKGFDIVGISLDRDRANLEDCIQARSILWPNVVGDGKPNPAMIYYGVTNLPTTMLVGADGKVTAVNVRGESLKRELGRILGPPEPEKSKNP
jgi:peroxiredoxin